MSRSDASYHHGNLGPVLEAAGVELLAQKPHTSISLRELAREADVSHNAPYHHFGDKAGLFKRLGEVSMQRLVGQFTAADSPALAPVERAVALGVAYVEFAVDNPHAFTLIYDPEVCIPGAPSAAMAPLIGELESRLGDAVAGLDPEAGQASIEARATALWATVQGLSHLVIAGHLSRAQIRPAITESLRC
ncbi:TetR/AcrR family transcriptional regulator [Pseudoclavibacter helvolus]|uniref:TetR/AcrR family transcriptional regulator n=1 Tax=Pseudoclavibacter helvolus TaxID=255205 RepID=UPI003C722E63